MARQFYNWLQSTDQVPVLRCKELLDKAYGSPVTYAWTAFHVFPMLHGCPVKGGPDAVPGNGGVMMLNAIHDAVQAGTASLLTQAEMDELKAFYAASIPLEQEWNLDPNDDAP